MNPLAYPRAFPKVGLTTPRADQTSTLTDSPTTVQTKDIYLFDRHSPDAAVSLSERFLELSNQARESLKASQFQDSLGSAQRPAQALWEYQKLKPSLNLGERAALGVWRETQQQLQELVELPYKTSDQVTRTQELYTSPGALKLRATAEEWEKDEKSGYPLVNAIVVGGGPGGLSTALQLQEQGQRLVLFEAGLVGQSFSDAGAFATHRLRTGTLDTDLAPASGPFARILRRQHPLSAQQSKNFRPTRDRLRRGQEQARERTKAAPYEWESDNPYSSNAHRSSFFQHMVQVATHLSSASESTVIERSSISAATLREDGLWEVESDRGHKLVTRNLVLAIGQVGQGGGAARVPDNLQNLPRDRVITLRQDSDLWQQAEALATHHQELKGTDGNIKTLVVSERLLGQQPIQLALARMEPGKRVAVVGGGESAAKAAVEILRQNPHLKMDLYTSKALTPSPLQVPRQEIASKVWTDRKFEGDYGEKSLRRLKKFGTPVTLGTLYDLFRLQQSGKLRIREMGEHFGSRSIELTPTTDGQIELQLKSQAARRALKESAKEFQSAGLLPQEDEPGGLPAADMFVLACGFDSKRRAEDPLLKSLVDQGALQLDPSGRPKLEARGIASLTQSNLFLPTAGAVAKASDTTIPGNRQRGQKIAEVISGRANLESLGPYAELTPIGDTEEEARKQEAEGIQSLVNDVIEIPKEQQQKTLDVIVASSNASSLFPSTYEQAVSRLQQKIESGDADAAEKMVYERGLALENRMRDRFGVSRLDRNEVKKALAELEEARGSEVGNSST